MSNKEQLAELERNIEASKQFVDVGAALTRLNSNKDFRTVVTSGYFEKEAIRLVHLKAEPGMQTPERQAAVIRDIDSIGAFHQYLMLVHMQAERAGATIKGDEETREEILRDELSMGGN